MADQISPVTETRDASLVREIALAFADGGYEGGETLFEMYANIALKVIEARGHAQSREQVIEECAKVAESYPSSGEQTEYPVEYWIRRLSGDPK